MAIVFPRRHPTTPSFRRLTIIPRSIVGVTAAPTSGVQQTIAHPGQWWEFGVTLPPMPRATAEEWVAFLLSCNGRDRTFLLGDPVGASPRGAVSGTPNVDGLHSIAVNSIAVDTLPASTNGLFLFGDWIQIGHNFLIDANALNTASWTKFQCTSSTNTIVAPNGITEAERVTPDGGATDAYIW